jgi:signal transduction histidine kinase
MAALGFLYLGFVLSASSNEVDFTVGMVVWAAGIVSTAYVLLCFPSGRLESGLERWFMVGFALSTAVLWVLILALAPKLPRAELEIACGPRCPANGLQVVNGHAGAGRALGTALSVVFTIAPIGVAMLIFNKARSRSRLRRRTMTPLAIVAIALVAEFATSMLVLLAYPSASQPFVITDYALTLAAPAAMLIGLSRGRAFAASGVGRIAMHGSDTLQTPPAVQRVIGDALGDPTLTLALWVPERAGYLDVHGAAMDLPLPGDGQRAVVPITRDSSQVAALIHDPALDTDAEVVSGLAATSLMLLENTRLVEELRESRARIVETAEHERLRLERDLHDGAQQRLMAIQVRLQMAQRHASGRELPEELGAISAEAKEAVEELRALAHGIYPSALRDGGLADGLRSLAMRSAITVTVNDEGIGRCTTAIEAALYFCALEAVQNATRHAGRGAAVTITLAHDRGGTRVAIADDGVGIDGHAPRDGVGLLSMHDRIGAVGGELDVSSSPGHGTVVRAIVPDRSEVSSEARTGGTRPRRFVRRGDPGVEVADPVKPSQVPQGPSVTQT